MKTRNHKSTDRKIKAIVENDVIQAQFKALIKLYQRNNGNISREMVECASCILTSLTDDQVNILQAILTEQSRRNAALLTAMNAYILRRNKEIENMKQNER